MANKSGASEQVISIPTGGGALSAIGETFSPDLHTGTGNFTVPLALPPGRNGLQPQLSLIYSTGNGNGPFGLGWSLSVPGIGRKTSKGIPQYHDYQAGAKRDVFVLSGAEDLVPIAEPGPGLTRYRPRTEGLFARIDHHHADGNSHWEVRSKDGFTSFYGTPDATTNDPASVADPDNRAHVFSWHLTLTEDTFGNHILYEYERDAGQEEMHHWDQLYLTRIRYIDYLKDGVTQYLVSVTLIYEERPDPFSSHHSGFEIRTRRRCTRIEIRTHADRERLVRRYRLVYLDQRADLADLASHLPANGISLLSQVRVEGIDEAQPPSQQTEPLPPLEFRYTPFKPENRRYRAFSAIGDSVPDRSLAHPEYELVGLFGNGLLDVVHMKGRVRYWRNLGDGRFDLPRFMDAAPFNADLALSGVQMADLDGDGRIDLLVTDGVRGGYFPLSFDGDWDPDGFVPYAAVPSISLEAPDVKLMDLDGDGITDALRTGINFELYYNDRYRGWLDVELRARDDPERFPNVNFDDPRVKLADMNGDDLQDIVFIHNRRIDYWPYRGYGRWGRRITMASGPDFEDAEFFPGIGFDPKRVLLGDIDGDGLADLVCVSSGHVTVWINQSGNSWSNPIRIDGTPLITDMDAVRLVDMLGIGTAGILWTYDFNAQLDGTYKSLDLTGGTKPYLLNEMDNHMGAVTRVTYAPSTASYLADGERPATRWKTTLPFPVLVVSEVEVDDHFSGNRLTTEYRYHHGYWDGAEREFRGFGMVEQLDTLRFPMQERRETPTPFTPPVLTKTWFHQGPVGSEFGDWQELDLSPEYWPEDPNQLERPNTLANFLDNSDIARRVKRDAIRALRGVILRTELYALDDTPRQDRPYTVTEAQYDVRAELLPEAGDRDRLPIFFAHPRTQRTTQWERGREPMTQFSFTDDYDQFGLPHQQTSLAVPRRRDYRVAAASAEPYLGTITRTEFAQRDDAQRYIVDRPSRITAFEIDNDGSQPLLQLYQAVRAATNDSQLKLFAQTLNYYDGEAFVGLELDQLGDFGALVRTETLVMTKDLLAQAFRSDDVVVDRHELPPYMGPAAAPDGLAEYPPEFQALTAPVAGFALAQGDDHRLPGGYYAQTKRCQHDFQDPSSTSRRGLIRLMRDPLGSDTAIAHDEFDLLPIRVTDAAGMTLQAEYDYRVLKPRRVTDPNRNQAEYSFTQLGLLKAIFIEGKSGENEGDRELASTRFEHDFLAFVNSSPGDRQPIFVRTIRREHHDTDTDVPLPEREATIKTVEYSDGFGRLLQTRAQAEDVHFGDAIFGNGTLPIDQRDRDGTSAPVVGRLRDPNDIPNVVVSGWQIYDNKGQVVEKFEPFFSQGFGYRSPDQERDIFGRSVLGQKVTLFYDPRGQVIRTVNPDGSEQRVIFGVPGTIQSPDLTTPNEFEPTPWETYIYDANDLAPVSIAVQSEGTPVNLADRAPKHHHFTTASFTVDALGRTVLAIARNRSALSEPIEEFRTRSTYDIRGNLLTITDALGREAFRHIYDLVNRPLRIENIDAGVRRIVLDALGNEVERRDSKGALTLQAYDILHRPIRLWARDSDRPEELSLRQFLIYGDSPGTGLLPGATTGANLNGKLFKHYDEAGLLTFSTYDFKGNVIEKTRRVVRDDVILAVFDQPRRPVGSIPAFRADWQPPAGGALTDQENALLDSIEYRTSMTYDALNRVKVMRYPQDQDNERQRLKPRYNRAGALEQVQLDDMTFVERIAYDAKGQRALIAYGNGVMTRYAYDPRTFRLTRLRTERFAKPDPFAPTYRPAGAPLQDFAYEYDLVGNIIAIRDRTPESGIPNTRLGPDALDRAFTYDPLYRLLSATGRECDLPPAPPPWDDAPRCADITRARAYAEQYKYDKLGNILRMQHAANGGSFTRDFTLASGNNRLATVSIGPIVVDYACDPNGNLIREGDSRHFEWDYADHMKAFRTQAGISEPSVHVHYLYDAGGMRAKKLVRKQGGRFESTTYIDGLFEHHRWQEGGGQIRQNNHLHVMDDQQRIALVRVGISHPDDIGPAVQFHLGDHLGSSNLVINQDGSFINREEYTPYGETSFGSFARKRYRFTGKERDEESGLNYHGARYYAPWVMRWIAPDPLGMVDGSNLYKYARNSPLNLSDPKGFSPEETNTLKINVDEVVPVSEGGSPTDPSNKQFLDELTNQRTKKNFSEITTRSEGSQPTLSLEQAAQEGPEAFQRAAGRTLTGRFSEIEELKAIAEYAAKKATGTNRRAIANSANRVIRDLIRGKSEPPEDLRSQVKLVRHALSEVGVDPNTLELPGTRKPPPGMRLRALPGNVRDTIVQPLNQVEKPIAPKTLLGSTVLEKTIEVEPRVSAPRLTPGVVELDPRPSGWALAAQVAVEVLKWGATYYWQAVNEQPILAIPPAAAGLGAPATLFGARGGYGALLENPYTWKQKQR